MSIATKTGDAGTTGLLFNRRVPKNHPRCEAYGSCDELNVALGLAKASLPPAEISFRNKLEQVQKILINVMGELATLPDDRERYIKAGHQLITAEETDLLTDWVNELESENIKFDGWATPGANLLAASLDQARVTCRRAERRVCSLEDFQKLHPHIVTFLNRFSDFLWLAARKFENPPEKSVF